MIGKKGFFLGRLTLAVVTVVPLGISMSDGGKGFASHLLNL
jgi:hypothetical protein